MEYIKAEFNIHVSKNASLGVQTARDVLQAMLGEAGFEAFSDTESGFTGYIQQTLYNGEAVLACVNSLPFEGVKATFKAEKAPDENWNSLWEEQGFEPIVVGDRCVIHDLGHSVRDCFKDKRQAGCTGKQKAGFEPLSFDLDIQIDAKQAFGTGTHETTRMIVSRLLDMPLENKSVLDCGTGTGILLIVAKKLGAADVLGYDIDSWSVNNALHNARLNGVDFSVLLGDASILEKQNRRFDVVLANINRNILLADMPSFAEHNAAGGILIMSGFLTEDEPIISRSASSLGYQLQDTLRTNAWSAMVFRKMVR